MRTDTLRRLSCENGNEADLLAKPLTDGG